MQQDEVEGTVDTEAVPREVDAVVIGAGPSGSALAAALSERGVSSLLVSPSWEWGATYGAWCDELHDLPYEVPFRRRWERAYVRFGEDSPVVLSHPYGLIDNARLSRFFWGRLSPHGRRVTDRVRRVSGSPGFFLVDLERLGVVSARLVFDASGHGGHFTHRPLGSPAYQTALGVRVVSGGHANPSGEGSMGLMSWDDGLEIETMKGRTPAFAYVLPENDEVSIIEVTVLASRPMISPDDLRPALEEWLDGRGLKRVDGDAWEERVMIPMGHDLPFLDQPVVGIGGAASEVHPATGYLVSRTLHTAERVADRVASLGVTRADARNVWEVVWPEEERRSWTLYRAGLEALLTLGPEETRDFFRAFFSLPDASWRGYLSRTASPSELAATMWALFRELPMPLRVRLMRSAFGRGAPHLWRGVRV